MSDKVDGADVPLWQQPWLRDVARDLAVPAALVLVALIAVFGLVRPALKAAFPPPAEQKDDTATNQLSVVEDEQLALGGPGGLPALEAPISNDKLVRARQLAKENPVAVANITRAWGNGEELDTAAPAGARR